MASLLNVMPLRPIPAVCQSPLLFIAENYSMARVTMCLLMGVSIVSSLGLLQIKLLNIHLGKDFSVDVSFYFSGTNAKKLNYWLIW